MKRGKALLAAMLALCLTFALAGCSKDTILDGYNDFLHQASKYALTNEKDLQGEKVEGADTYTGSYTAEYDGFSGTEYLFGGTGLEREIGNELTVTYEMTVKSGFAELYWIEGMEEHLITDTSGNDIYTISLSSQDNYIAVKGKSLQGSLSLTVE